MNKPIKPNWGNSGRDAKPGFGVKHGQKRDQGENINLKKLGVQGVRHDSEKGETVEHIHGRGEYGVRVKGVPENIHVGGSRENEYVANCGRGAREKSVDQENRDKGRRRDPEKDRALRLDNKS